MMKNEIKKLVHLPSRCGRELQRFHMGRRQVVGCIPYRRVQKLSNSVQQVVEVLMISSQKGEAMLFPKGGWEKDETKQQAASRECLEEGGVIGSIQTELGHWIYKSKNQDTLHDVYMFPLLVEEQLDYWPEKDIRQRKWVMVTEAKKLCQHMWMREALEELVQRLDIVEGGIDHILNGPKFLSSEAESEKSDFRILSLQANVPVRSSTMRDVSPHKTMEHEAMLCRQHSVIEKKSFVEFHLSSEAVFRCSRSGSYVHRLNGISTLLRSAV